MVRPSVDSGPCDRAHAREASLFEPDAHCVVTPCERNVKRETRSFQVRMRWLMGQGECAAPSPFGIRRRSSARLADEARASIARAELRRRGARGATILTENDADRRRFAALLEEAPVGYVITDGYGKIIEGNAAVSSLLHLDVVSLPGKRLLNYVVRDSRRGFYAALLRLREVGVVENVSVVIRPRKGAPLVGVTLNALAKHERDGRLIAVHWFLRGLAPGSSVTPSPGAPIPSLAPVAAAAP